MRNGGVSFWFAQLGGPPARRPPLPGPRAADVAIVGGGYTGLWTALQLKRAAPELDVVVLEREFAGFGASGRNGGWLSGVLAGSRERWAARHGRPAVARAQRLMFATVDLVAAEGIPCDLVKGGTLTVATAEPQARRLRERVEYERSWGFGEDDVRLLEPAELAARVRVPAARGALFSPHCARVHPARLVRGLAERVEDAGAVIHESTPALAIEPYRVRTPAGDVRARWVVRATEGYTARLPGSRRALVPMNSAMIVTEPLRETWEAIGWDQCETMLDGAHAYCYLQRTPDGRIAIGGRGWPYRFGSRTDRAGEVRAGTVAALRERLTRLFPTAGSVPAAHAWAGVLGVPRDWCPSVGCDRATGLCWAGGYVGDGVSTAHLAGRTLRDLILERDTEEARLPWVGHRAPRWEPEPLRWLAIHGLYAAYRRADRDEERTGRTSRLARWADRGSGRSLARAPAR